MKTTLRERDELIFTGKRAPTIYSVISAVDDSKECGRVRVRGWGVGRLISYEWGGNYPRGGHQPFRARVQLDDGRTISTRLAYLRFLTEVPTNGSSI
jgi:hypothetical protein